MLPNILEEEAAPPPVPSALPVVRQLSNGYDIEHHNAPSVGVMTEDAVEDGHMDLARGGGKKSDSMGGTGEAIQAGWAESPQPPKPGSGPMRPSVSASPRPAA